MINKQRLVDEFIELVKIDSESLDEKNIADVLEKKLRDLGLEVWRDDAGKKYGGNAGNVMGRLKGNTGGEPLLFAAHMDTVKPGRGVKPVIENDIIKSDGTTVLGGDDKSGIVAILEMIRVIKENNMQHGDIEVLFTFGEEIGLLGAKTVDTSKLKARQGFALDSEEVSKIVYKAPAQNSIEFEIFGKESHAGVSPEKGVSAIEVAADAINHMKLGRIDAETTANIGMIEGGRATNIVTGYVKMKGEARSHNLEKLGKQTRSMIEAVWDAVERSKKYSSEGLMIARSKETVEREYDRISVDTNELSAQLAYKAINEVGLKAEFVEMGGGSDANILNGKGIKMVILGTGMSNVHTKEEYIKISDMVDITRIVLNIIKFAYA